MTYSIARRPDPAKLRKLVGAGYDKKDIDPLLFNILSVGAPHGEERLLEPYLPKGFYRDPWNNYVYNVGRTRDHGTMFSCHLDVASWKLLKIVPHMDQDNFVWGCDVGGKSTLIGADDKIGAYLMLKMMAAKIPGVYVFHAGEERGCIGSRARVEDIKKRNLTILSNIKRCIAFDRAGYQDVITYQRGTKCASDEFARALSDQLNRKMPPASKFQPCPDGVYTDSACYTNQIAECTNLSVGYFNQHGDGEHFDNLWLEQYLLPAVLQVKWSELVTVRKPGDNASKPYVSSYIPKGKRDLRDGPAMNGTKPTIPVKGDQSVIPFPGNTGYAPWDQVNEKTPWDKIPLWTVADGIPVGATPLAMSIAIKKYIVEHGVTKTSQALTSLFYVLQNYKTLNEKLTRETAATQSFIDVQAEELDNAQRYIALLRSLTGV